MTDKACEWIDFDPKSYGQNLVEIQKDKEKMNKMNDTLREVQK